MAFHNVTWVCYELLLNLMLLRRKKLAITNYPCKNIGDLKSDESNGYPLLQ
jgi:hypothetical protein